MLFARTCRIISVHILMFDQFICPSIRGRHKLISCSQRILLPTRITSNKPENALKILKWLTGETAQTCGLWIRLGQWTVWWANDHSEPISRKHRGGDWLSLNWITRSITAPAITLKFPKPKIWDASLYYCTIHLNYMSDEQVREARESWICQEDSSPTSCSLDMVCGNTW